MPRNFKTNQTGVAHLFLLLVILTFIIAILFYLRQQKSIAISENLPNSIQQEISTNSQTLKWQNLTLYIDENSFDTKSNISLSSFGHLNSNKFSILDRYDFSAVSSEKNS